MVCCVRLNIIVTQKSVVGIRDINGKHFTHIFEKKDHEFILEDH